jgi:hypothetical protein
MYGHCPGAELLIPRAHSQGSVLHVFACFSLMLPVFGLGSNLVRWVQP